MATKKKAKKKPEPSSGTGVYVYPPCSNTKHGPFAVQLKRGANCFHATCTCGVRVYYPAKDKLSEIKAFTPQEIMSQGGVCLDLLERMVPSTGAPPPHMGGSPAMPPHYPLPQRLPPNPRHAPRPGLPGVRK